MVHGGGLEWCVVVVARCGCGSDWLVCVVVELCLGVVVVVLALVECVVSGVGVAWCGLWYGGRQCGVVGGGPNVKGHKVSGRCVGGVVGVDVHLCWCLVRWWVWWYWRWLW